MNSGAFPVLRRRTRTLKNVKMLLEWWWEGSPALFFHAFLSFPSTTSGHLNAAAWQKEFSSAKLWALRCYFEHLEPMCPNAELLKKLLSFPVIQNAKNREYKLFWRETLNATSNPTTYRSWMNSCYYGNGRLLLARAEISAYNKYTKTNCFFI